MTASKHKEGRASSQAPSRRPESVEDGAGGNIDKIRDIIFGSQMQEYDRRFRALEDRLLKASADLRTDLDKRVSTLESYFRKELESLGASLKTEQQARASSLEEAVAKLAELRKHAMQQLTTVANEAVERDRDLRGQLEERAQSLSREIQDKVTALTVELKREADELRQGKTDRTGLAALLSEMALRLAEEAPPKDHGRKKG
ncbi:MAG TPA: OmpH family outer membrane protein [Gemmatimonadales bacterium]|nr:OmpH family outer membrane protein [Gemmatimonadales bacterium]